MFLYFSDWTDSVFTYLKEIGAKRIIKVFATELDLPKLLQRELIRIAGDSNPFEEAFKYPERGLWTPEDLETHLESCGLSEEAKSTCRALFRFANREELEIAELAMSVRDRNTTNWHFQHPFHIIDGLGTKREDRFGVLHLDIFTPRSLERLAGLVDLENSQGLVTPREAALIGKNPEGISSRKETH